MERNETKFIIVNYRRVKDMNTGYTYYLGR